MCFGRHFTVWSCCPDTRNQKWPRMGIITNETKVWTDHIWGKNNAKHDGDTPGAQLGHETAENDINPKIKIQIFVDGQSSSTHTPFCFWILCSAPDVARLLSPNKLSASGIMIMARRILHARIPSAVVLFALTTQSLGTMWVNVGRSTDRYYL